MPSLAGGIGMVMPCMGAGSFCGGADEGAGAAGVMPGISSIGGIGAGVAAWPAGAGCVTGT